MAGSAGVGGRRWNAGVRAGFHGTRASPKQAQWQSCILHESLFSASSASLISSVGKNMPPVKRTVSRNQHVGPYDRPDRDISADRNARQVCWSRENDFSAIVR
jgi:hypothetical protein